MQVFFTGLSGFVGTHLDSFLKQHGVMTIPLNLRDALPAGLPGADALIHLAGKAHDLKNTDDDQEYFKVNTELTKQLFDLFLQSSARDFIYLSSVKAAADTVEEVLTEEVQADPKTPYGLSKLKAEKYILKQDLPEGKRIFILRPCMIHGPGNKGNLNLLYQFVKKGIPYPLAAFENKRSFLSVQNLLFVIEKLLNDPSIPGGVYNLADDEALSTNNVIEIIGLAGERKAGLWNINPSLIRAMAKVGDKLFLPLNTERLKKLTESYVVSNKKIKNALGISQFPVSSREGLIHTIKSFENK